MAYLKTQKITEAWIQKTLSKSTGPGAKNGGLDQSHVAPAPLTRTDACTPPPALVGSGANCACLKPGRDLFYHYNE